MEVLLRHRIPIQLLHLFPGPGRLPQEFQAGFYGGIIIEAANIDMFAHLDPAILILKMNQHHLQSHPMHGVVCWFRCTHDVSK